MVLSRQEKKEWEQQLLLGRTNNAPLRPNNVPLRPNNVPLRPNNVPLRPNNAPLRLNDLYPLKNQSRNYNANSTFLPEYHLTNASITLDTVVSAKFPESHFNYVLWKKKG
jgi:hypothetical protein